MKTTMTILRTDGTQLVRDVELPEEPTYPELKMLLWATFGTNFFEHSRVLVSGHAVSMFVDEMGHQKGLQRNEAATTVYRAASLRADPFRDQERLPHIVGDAVLFSRNVWS